MNAFFEHHKDNIRLSLLRSDPAPCRDPALSTGTAGRRLFLDLSPDLSSQSAGVARHRYAVPQLGQEPLPEMGCIHSRRSPRPAR